MYKYEYSNQRRVKCPHCEKEGKYSVCVNSETGEFTEDKYGMCSSCNKYELPPDNYINEGEHINENDDDKPLGFFDADGIDPDLWLKKEMKYKEQFSHNNFIENLEKRFGEEKVDKMIDLYQIGRFYNGGVIFPYFYTDEHLTTGKILWYDNYLHRIHEKTPKWLHSMKTYYEERWYDNDYDRTNGYYPHGGYWHDFVTKNEYDCKNRIVDESTDTAIIIEETEKFKLKMSLFGHNLIINDTSKTVCLVESEKTACVMSMLLPEYIWIASGSATYIQQYKFLAFANRKCYVFPDMSTDDVTFLYWKKTLEKYNNKCNCNFQLINYYTDFVNKHYKEYSTNSTPEELLIIYKEKGYDVADFILDYNTNDRYLKFFKALLENVKSVKLLSQDISTQMTIW